MITLSEAEKLLEQFKPAFAGYLTDGDISERDILATLLDLSVRGYIKLDMEKKGDYYEIHNIGLEQKSIKLLLPFEREFIGILFPKSKEISLDNFQYMLHKKTLHNVIENHLQSLKENEIVTRKLIFRNDEDKQVNFGDGKSAIKTVEKAKGYQDLIERYKSFKMPSESWFLIATSLLFIGIGISSGTLWSILYGIVILLIPLWEYRKFRKLKKTIHIKFKDAIPFTKKKYEELFEFIRKFPFKEQRIYNEFMPFAVAFGLDTSWNKSFGINTEPVISSKIK